MRKLVVLLVSFVIFLSLALPVYAENGKVLYSGNARGIFFEPGSDHSLTDLFPDFKDVMPGDTLTQKITVKNNADNKVKVRLFIRSLGAQDDSVEFLSKLGLKVAASKENKMSYMFDAAANETAGLTDWAYLGVLYSGGEVDLDVTLEVPTELDNKFQDSVGLLDWEFMVEELPTDESDPKPPQTGDSYHTELWIVTMAVSASLIIIILLFKKRKQQTQQ